MAAFFVFSGLDDGKGKRGIVRRRRVGILLVKVLGCFVYFVCRPVRCLLVEALIPFCMRYVTALSSFVASREGF